MEETTLDELFSAIDQLPWEPGQCLNGELRAVKSIAQQLDPPRSDAGETDIVKRVRALVRADLEVKAIKRRLKAAEQHRAKLGGGMVDGEWVEGELAEALVENGMASMKVDGRLVYLRQDAWLFRDGEIDQHAACVALRRAGLKSLTGETYNAQGLRSWFKERVEQAGRKLKDHGRGVDLAEYLPPTIRKAFAIQVRTTVATRKG